MIIIGLTGSIATGKSFVAKCFNKLGAAVFDVDKNVHEILTFHGEAVKEVRNLFPESYHEGEIDRKKLGDIVFKDDLKRKKLENIIYPILEERRKEFLEQAKDKRVSIVVLEIPLLYENNLQSLCDHVVVTDVDKKLQRIRALERPGMTEEKFLDVNRLQMDNALKVMRADFVIDTAVSEFAVFRKVKEIIKKVLG